MIVEADSPIADAEKGYLTGVGNADSSSTCLHGALGRVRKSTQTTNGVTYTFVNPGDSTKGYAYNAAGLLTSIWYPSGRTVSHGYDNAGRATSAGSYASSVSYSPHGAISSLTLGNGVVETTGYNNRLQPNSMEAVLSGSSKWKLENFYCASQQSSCASNNGNVISQRLTAPKTAGGTLVLTQAYGHDSMNRLSSAAESGSGTAWSQGYTLDRYGNLTPTGDQPAPSLACGSYSSSTNRCNSAGFGYSTAGNMNAFPGSRTATYDAEGRQATLTDSGTTYTYTYDGDGRRVKKDGGGTTVKYVYDALGRLAAEYSTAAASSPCATCYLTADHLGSTRLMTNHSGTPVRRYDYFPFGQEIASGYGSRTTVTGYTTDTLNPKFTGKPRDYESGLQLDYFGARYFEGAMGRFTGPDPVAGSLFNPQSLNMYAYTWNNPLRYTDPTGMVVSWEDSEAKCRSGETGCRTDLQRRYEDRIRQLQSSRDNKDVAKGNALAATYGKLQDAKETFHVVREGGNGSGELTYRGDPGNLFVEMKGGGSAYGEMPDIQKLAHEFKHGEQFLEGLIGFTNITGKWRGYRDDLVDEANAFMAGFMAMPVGGDQSKFLKGLGQATQWGIQEVVKKLNAPGSPYQGRPTQQIPITTIPPSVYAVPRSK